MACSCLSDEFKNKVFKELSFQRLRQFEIWGSLAPGSVTGQQQLAFMFPNGASGIKPELRIERLVLNNVPSPIHIKLMDKDHCVIFESTLEVEPPIVKNFFRPIWIPLPRVSFFRVPYRGQVVFERQLFMGVPCHKNCATRSRSAVGMGSKVVEVEEMASEDGRQDGGGRTDETEAKEEADGEPEVLFEVQDLEEVGEDGGEEDEGQDLEEVGSDIRAYGPKIIQVFQPNRVTYFQASKPAFIRWQREYSSISTDYEVKFRKEDQIQEHLRTGSHATILVSAEASNLTTVGMTFSFTGED